MKFTSAPELETDLSSLQQLLHEAEEMRTAIARGEVDAFVIGDESNRRVMLLANAYQRYRQLVERMQQGAITVSNQGAILYANHKFSQMLGIPLSQLYTAPLEAYVSIGERSRLASFLMLSSRDSSAEVSLNRRDGATIPVKLSLATYTDGYITLLVTDLRPMQWPSLTMDALDAIRDSLEKLNRKVAPDPAARDALRDISEEINGLARMIDEMLDVEGRAKGS